MKFAIGTITPDGEITHTWHYTSNEEITEFKNLLVGLLAGTGNYNSAARCVELCTLMANKSLDPNALYVEPVVQVVGIGQYNQKRSGFVGTNALPDTSDPLDGSVTYYIGSNSNPDEYNAILADLNAICPFRTFYFDFEGNQVNSENWAYRVTFGLNWIQSLDAETGKSYYTMDSIITSNVGDHYLESHLELQFGPIPTQTEIIYYGFNFKKVVASTKNVRYVGSNGLPMIREDVNNFIPAISKAIQDKTVALVSTQFVQR